MRKPSPRRLVVTVVGRHPNQAQWCRVTAWNGPDPNAAAAFRICGAGVQVCISFVDGVVPSCLFAGNEGIGVPSLLPY